MLLYHLLGAHDGEFGAWAFHKQGNGGFTKVLARAASSAAEIRLESPVDRVNTRGPCAASRSTVAEFHAPIVVSALIPADVPRAGRPARAAHGPRRFDPAVPVPGHVGEGQLRARRHAAVPGPRRPDGSVPRVHEHRAVDGVPRARLRRRQVRLVLEQPYLDCAIQSTVDPTWRRPARRSCRASSSTRRTTSERQLGFRSGRRLGDTVQATIESFFPGFGTWSSSARSERRSTSSGPSACPRATSSPASSSRRRCGSCGRRSAGRTTGRRSTGYYQCGSGTHPGGCVMGAPGKLASQAGPEGPRARRGIEGSLRRPTPGTPRKVSRGPAPAA